MVGGQAFPVFSNRVNADVQNLFQFGWQSLSTTQSNKPLKSNSLPSYCLTTIELESGYRINLIQALISRDGRTESSRRLHSRSSTVFTSTKWVSAGHRRCLKFCINHDQWRHIELTLQVCISTRKRVSWPVSKWLALVYPILRVQKRPLQSHL